MPQKIYFNSIITVWRNGATRAIDEFLNKSNLNDLNIFAYNKPSFINSLKTFIVVFPLMVLEYIYFHISVTKLQQFLQKNFFFQSSNLV